MKKIRFVVQDDNLLGYILPEFPNAVQILETSTIRGSIYSWVDGSAPSHPRRQRPATVRDFKSFRCDHRPYANPERYEPIPD